MVMGGEGPPRDGGGGGDRPQGWGWGEVPVPAEPQPDPPTGSIWVWGTGGGGVALGWGVTWVRMMAWGGGQGVTLGKEDLGVRGGCPKVGVNDPKGARGGVLGV